MFNKYLTIMKVLFVCILVISMSSCGGMQGAGSTLGQSEGPAGGTGGVSSTGDAQMNVLLSNPIVGLELDLLLGDVLATNLIMNNVLMTRIQFTGDDPWTSLITEFKETNNLTGSIASGTSGDCQKGFKDYSLALAKTAESDYTFYKLFSVRKIIESLNGVGGIMTMGTDLMSGKISSVKKFAALNVVENYVNNLSHNKSVISAIPSGCYLKYPNIKYETDYDVKSQFCKSNYKNLKTLKCELFTKPLEDVVHQYSSSKKDVEVDTKCFRVVKGVNAHQTFKDAFYSILPDSLTKDIKQADADLDSKNDAINKLTGEIKQMEAQAETASSDKSSAKKVDTSQLEVKKKDLSVLENDRKNILQTRSKLYKEAVNTHLTGNDVESQKQKAILAQKMQGLINYIDGSLNSTTVMTTLLTAAIVFDIKDLIPVVTNPTAAINSVSQLITMTHPNVSKEEAASLAEKRAKLLFSRLTSYPGYVFSIISGVSAQKDFVAQYKNYIDHVVNVGLKKKYITAPAKETMQCKVYKQPVMDMADMSDFSKLQGGQDSTESTVKSKTGKKKRKAKKTEG
ncbi:MAG: hypothetical protein HQK88_06690 [Nitrospirae bacterium]|nr:hypothetical protein [Nitrospirota bacterium]MBF0534814.1 hypothetical protein [Nitrospirota bacterium]MBF0616488.1 hypothetical protein [Nitrospirota bacterium]